MPAPPKVRQRCRWLTSLLVLLLVGPAWGPTAAVAAEPGRRASEASPNPADERSARLGRGPGLHRPPARHSKAGPRTENEDEFAPRRSSAGDGSDPDPAGQPQARQLRREARRRVLALRRKLSREAALRRREARRRALALRRELRGEAALRRREARERALALRRKLRGEAALRRREARERALDRRRRGAKVSYAGPQDDPTTATSAGATSADSDAAGQPSTFFATAYAQEYDTYNTNSEGDLWPSCWCEDDYLYAANGDGDGFTVSRTGTAPDIAVSQISGVPGNLSGKTIAKGDQLGKVWDTSGNYNRKPTGMVCVDGVLYLAVQDLHKDFNDAPNASISMSLDKGVTWTFDATAPMFSDHVFTTIMFLDYGKNSAHAPDSYVYAYGLDYNWRDSFNDRVPDPTKVYLGRVPSVSVLDRSTWEFFAGTDSTSNPTWVTDIALRAPVLEDARRIYQSTRDPNHPSNMTVISQGSVVYVKPLNRYLYTSWTEYTFEFYEAAAPWGPWRHFLTKDYGGYPWSDTKNGGYATTIPSKFISSDGKTLYVQSNTWVGGTTNYNFSLRKLVLEPFLTTTPSNAKSSKTNLARSGDGTTPIGKVAHFGKVSYFNNGILRENEDSWDQENKATDWWGYTWKRAYNVNRVVYTTGKMFTDGGWFSSDLRVQVRQNFDWVDVTNLAVTPTYPYDSSAGRNKTYTFTFDDTWGDGVRIIGAPGGTAYFTSIGELGVYYQ